MKQIVSVCAVMIAMAGGVAGVASVSGSEDTPGALFALTNSTAGNAVVMWSRHADGSLGEPAAFGTGGTGTGAGLGSQDAVIVSHDHRWLFAVNAGSNSVSSFSVGPHGLRLVDVEPSGGVMPTSVTYNDGLLFVLNAGTPNNVSGFTVDQQGRIAPLPASARPLSGASTSPAQVAFARDGSAIVVTERATNRIDVFAVGDDGGLDGPFVYPSAGPVPFGFAIDRRNTVFVSEAGAGGGASSYRLSADGGLAPVMSTVMTGQRAACWALMTKNGRFGYVTNAGTGNISGFSVSQDGTIALLDVDGVTATTGGNPTDMAMSHDGRYLYARVAALSQIAIHRIASDGSLETLAPLTGTPPGLAGLAGY